MGRYYIADTHFGHEAIIKYENRPYKNVEEMDRDLIKKWNETVSEDDTVYLVGDFSFYNKAESADVLRHLNGKKKLVMGNHDELTLEDYYQMGFYRVYDYPVADGWFWISHEPLYICDGVQPYANIFGHVHANRQYTDCSSQSFCVSAERIGYRPISFETIVERMKEAQAEEARK